MALETVSGFAPPLRCLELRRAVGTAGGFKRCTESRVVVGLSMGDYVDTNCLVIHLGHRDEHSAAGKRRHDFDEHRTSLLWHVR
jgi:hypothetical protein